MSIKLYKCKTSNCTWNTEEEYCAECKKNQALKLLQLVEEEIKSQRESDEWCYKHHNVDDSGRAYLCFNNEDVAELLESLLEDSKK